MLAHEVEQQTDDLVFEFAQPLGAAPAVTILEQQFLGLAPAFAQCGFKPPRQRHPHIALAAGVDLRELFQFGGDRAAVDQVGRCLGGRCGGRAGCMFEGEGGHKEIGIAEAER
jgi:hypothetical protein